MTQTYNQDCLIDTWGRWQVITLNQPHRLNAITAATAERLRQSLIQWRDDDSVQAVMIHGTGTRAFCAGGDLHDVYRAQMNQDYVGLEQLFRSEYGFVVQLHEFTKPYVAFLHGICMGAGLGASVHGSHRPITPNAVVAMPEVKIGYFPDVGGSWFLGQAPGTVGLYLALTGNAMKAEDALYAGMATHYIDPNDVPTIKQQLVQCNNINHDIVTECLQRYHRPVPHSLLQHHSDEINQLFQYDSLDNIIERLQTTTSTFARTTLDTLLTRSPTSLRITFELMKRIRGYTFHELMNTEFILSQKLVRGHDFKEGIRAAVIDKDQQPRWQPSGLNILLDTMIEEYFTPMPDQLCLIDEEK